MEGWKSFPSLSFLSQAESYVPFISPKLVNPREKSLPKPSLILIQKNSKTLRDHLHSHSLPLSLSLSLSQIGAAQRVGRPWAQRPWGRPAGGARWGSSKSFFLLLYFLANFDGISLDLSVYWLISMKIYKFVVVMILDYEKEERKPFVYFDIIFIFPWQK